jgi:hypothetical protein
MVKFKLLQIRDIDNCRYSFLGFNTARQMGFSLNDYDVVYEGFVDDEDALESLFYIFNADRPEDFKGRSMSVSDVVELDGKYYYTDILGFKEIE